MNDIELDMIKLKKLERMMTMEEKPQFKNDKIIVYSTSTCPYCTMAKDYLKSKGVKFEDVNVQLDQTRAREMIQKSGQMGVPVIDFKGNIIIGFDKGRIDSLLLA